MRREIALLAATLCALHARLPTPIHACIVGREAYQLGTSEGEPAPGICA